ncbi:hypothetical protein RFF05_07505 [Bengtsoniella intestinalis]|uniref:hypothetical protein n=1 Tax=Bengtsoniella intestinalis TaxID=3073143 RepID=UPI00391F8C05
MDVGWCGGAGGWMTVVALSATAPTHTHNLGTPKKWHHLTVSPLQGEARQNTSRQIRHLGAVQKTKALQR